MTDSALPSKVPTSARSDESEGMSYLESLPRRLVTLYLPLFVVLIVLLFPFYWMAPAGGRCSASSPIRC